MEKNKEKIVIIVAIICFLGLGWYIYTSFFQKETKIEKKETKIQFEIPEISNKEHNTSKIKYYNDQLKPDYISKRMSYVHLLQ